MKRKTNLFPIFVVSIINTKKVLKSSHDATLEKKKKKNRNKKLKKMIAVNFENLFSNISYKKKKKKRSIFFFFLVQTQS